MRLLSFICLLALTYVSRANDPIIEIPFTIEHEHIYVHIKLNGKDNLRVAFDTGARANLLDKKKADELGVDISGSQTVSGVAGLVTMDLSSGNYFEIGGFRVRRQSFLLMDLDHLGDEDTPMDGVIGGGIFDDYVVDINYDQQLIRLYDFKGYQPPKDYRKQTFSLRNFRVPIVNGTFYLQNGESVSGKFLVDTGAALAFSANTPFSKRNDLYSKMGDSYQYRFRAVSSENVTDIARLEKAEIFGTNFENMAVRLARSNAGVSGSDLIAGIVGLEVLKRFNTVYDYYRQTMYLQPSEYMDTPFKINYSGLKVKKENGMLLVQDVFEGSAAEKANIKKGDRIKSVDGKLNMLQDDFHPYMQKAKGAVDLEILRDGQLLKIKLLPKAMI